MFIVNIKQNFLHSTFLNVTFDGIEFKHVIDKISNN